MAAFELVLILLAAAAALEVLAERLGLPRPILLVVGGAILAILPGVPRPTLNPELIFLVFVPPLLYATAVQSSVRDFRRHARSITLLSVGMVVATTVVVAAVAVRVAPVLTWPAAFALGAIVAPPDAVAVTALGRRLGIPSRIVTVLEGESLFNDATALVLYRVAVGAAMAETVTAASILGDFVVDAVGGVAIGLGLGLVIGPLLLSVSRWPPVATTFSLLTPFVVYIPADHLGVSGVLAVVAAGLSIGRRSAYRLQAATRVLARNTWSVVSFLLEGMIFMLVGLELPRVFAALQDNTPRELMIAAVAVSGAVIVVRMVLVPIIAVLISALRRPRRPPRWRDILFLGWAGIRGGDSLVIALALPLTAAGGAPFPGRALILFVTVAVIVTTLVLQGLTLKPILVALKLEKDDSVEREEADARARLASLRATLWQRGGPGADPRKQLRDMIAAEYAELVRLRDTGVIGEAVLRRIQRDLDLGQMLLETPGAPELVLDETPPEPGRPARA